jgi:hypothetical protein
VLAKPKETSLSSVGSENMNNPQEKMQQPNPTNLNSVELQQLTSHNTNANAQTNQVDIQTDDNNLNQAKSNGLQSNKRADRQGLNELTDDESDEEDGVMDAEYSLAIAQLARSIEKSKRKSQTLVQRTST